MKLPQLSLRDLFWLVLVCAFAVGWWVDRNRVTRLHKEIAIEVAIHSHDNWTFKDWRDRWEAEKAVLEQRIAELEK